MAYTFKHGDRPLDSVTIQRAVGRGGFGEVYYALTDSGKQVALKYLRDNPEIELRGISHVMNLKSPHLITIYDVRSNAQSEPFVVMEYISGPSLLELMTAAPKGMGPQKAAFFLNGIAKGLNYLHDRGIVHRDLKPGNIFYDDGYVKIGDYGLSKHMSVSRHSGNTVSVGTVHYMAPEIGSGNYTKAIDIYALGVILYEMLTGRLPFSGSSMAEILMRHLQDRPDLSGVPEPFAGVIARALQKNPTDRYQDVNEMVDAVMSAADIHASFQSFDPTSLSQTPRDPEIADRDRTHTTPPRPMAPPPLDVHAWQDAARGVIPPIPPIPPMPGEARYPGRREAMHGVAAAQPAHDPTAMPLAGRERWPSWVMAVIVLASATGLLTLISGSGQDETPIALGLFLAGATTAALLTKLGILPRTLVRSPLTDRLLYGGAGFVCMLPGLAVASDSERHIPLMIIPMIAILALCDWDRRIEDGQRGKVRMSWIWGAGIVGFVAAAIAARGHVWTGAGMGIALSLIVQIVAGFWPARAVAGRSPVPAAAAVPPVPPPPPFDPNSANAGNARWTEAPSAFETIRKTVADHWTRQPRPASAAASSLAQTPVPTSAAGRIAFGIISIFLVAVSLGCLFANASISAVPPSPPNDPAWAERGPGAASQTERAAYQKWQRERYQYREARETKGALLFGTLAPLAAVVFFGRKALQRVQLPVWRGTVRFLFAALGLILVSGMIALLSGANLNAEERAGAVFGLSAGATFTLACLAWTGRRPAWLIRPGASQSTPRAPGRVFCGAVSAVLLAGSVGCFFARIALPAGESPAPPNPAWVDDPPPYNPTLFETDKEAKTAFFEFNEWDNEVREFEDLQITRAALLFGTLAPLAGLLFFARKATQRGPQPIWRGTLRYLVASLGLILVSGMIALLGSETLQGGERAAAIFGLVVGSVVSLGCLAFAGPGAARPAAAPAEFAGSSPQFWPPHNIAASAQQVANQAMAAATSAVQSAAASFKRDPYSSAWAGGNLAAAGAAAQNATPATITGDAPSFAGRAANAGLSFIGKFLLLAGVTFAVVSHAGPVQIGDRSKSVTLGQGRIELKEDGKVVLARQLAPPVFLVPTLLGVVFLALSRRSDGGAHVARGLIGGLMLLGAVAFALGPASGTITQAFSGEPWDAASDKAGLALLIPCAALAGLATLLLTWPSRRQRATIVV